MPRGIIMPAIHTVHVVGPTKTMKLRHFFWPAESLHTDVDVTQKKAPPKWAVEMDHPTHTTGDDQMNGGD